MSLAATMQQGKEREEGMEEEEEGPWREGKGE